YGQQVAIVRIRRGADPDFIVRLPDGPHAAIAMSLTNYIAPASVLPGAAAHLLDLGGLRQVVQLLDRLRAAGRFPTTDHGDGPDLVGGSL
ncbi:MAG: DNA recombination protein RmuC, partial [Chloroflexota bacterium]|nr:DNA recombination protein RmuC [Chloroflexota bacterium]